MCQEGKAGIHRGQGLTAWADVYSVYNNAVWTYPYHGKFWHKNKSQRLKQRIVLILN